MDFRDVFLTFCVVWLNIAAFSYADDEFTYKICNVFDQSTNEACQQVSRNGNFSCQHTRQRLDCIFRLEDSINNLAHIKANEALLAANFVQGDKIKVIGEVLTGQPEFETVVIVRNNINSFEDLKGKKYCHPGYQNSISHFLLDELDRKILGNATLSCTDGLTNTERTIKIISEYFSSSCRPGTWARNNDDNLKRKYPNMCQACSTGNCNILYKDPFNDVLTDCLKNGDVALTSIHSAYNFFNTSNNAQEYKYLCKDGTVKDVKSPCVWTKELNDLIVADRGTAEYLKRYITEKLKNYIGDTLGTYDVYQVQFLAALQIESSVKLRIPSDTKSLKTYVESIRTIPALDTRISCNPITWCTANDLENQKCQWLSQAAKNRGIMTPLKCSRSAYNDTKSCIDDIAKGTAELAYISSSYAYTGLKRGLTTVAYLETNPTFLDKIVVVVNKNSAIQRIAELNGKQACFPNYNGKEWLAFTNYIVSKNLAAGSRCDEESTFGAFFGSSCMPGARDSDISDQYKEKVCSQCLPAENTGTAKNCNDDNSNKYFGNSGALTCIADSAGDYAVISINDRTINTTRNVTFLCKSGKSDQITEDCFLTTVTSGGVMIKKNNSNAEDIIHFLRDIEYLFGQDINKIFKVFEAFDRQRDLLFPDSTLGLTFTDMGNSHIENYKALLPVECIKEVANDTTQGPNGDNTDGASSIQAVSLFLLAFMTVKLYLLQ